MTTAQTKKNQQPLTGKVVSNKMEKTVVVLVEDTVKAPLYKKYVRRSRKLLAHDETNQCQEGSVVVISQAKPYSRRKTWKVEKVIK
ncbi:MAG: ribosomal protein [Gammaproteobacteria bacterium]|jgi:small subunit ribosomal protein S17|nr:ribosomal protein [Gammaproteobacteria bacterium]